MVIQRIKAQLTWKGIQVHHWWVKGHQDQHKQNTGLSSINKFNVEMDKAVESTSYNLNYDWMGSAHVPVFPGEQWALFINDKKVTTDLQNKS